MSLLWRDLVTVGVSPAGIAALRHCRGLRPSLSAQEYLPCAADSGWTALKTQLSGLFERPEWQHCDVRYVLSSHFVRYAVVPADPDVRGAAERTAFTPLVFEKIYGSLAREWDIRLSPAGSREAALACGVDRTLLAALRDSARPTVHIAGIRPHLMCAINAIAKRLAAGPAAIALAEPARITLAFAQAGRWLGVASRAVEAADGETLQQALTEQGALLGVSAGGALWLNDLAGGCALPADSLWQIKPFGDTEKDAPYRLAALGAGA